MVVAPRRRLSSPSGLSRHTLPASLLRRPRGSRRRDVVRVGGRRRGDEGARGGRRAANAPRGPSRRGDDGDAHRSRARLTTIAPPRGPPSSRRRCASRASTPSARTSPATERPGTPRRSRTRTTSGATPPPPPSSTTRRIARAHLHIFAPLFFVRRLGRIIFRLHPSAPRAHPPRAPHATRPHPDRTPAPAPCS